MELAKGQGGGNNDDKVSYWYILPPKLQEIIVDKSTVLQVMEKAREKAQQWQIVHEELNKLPRCHRH